jgi:hypothetical protein
MAITSVTVRADGENNAETWWDAMRAALPALRETDPEIADLLLALERRGEVEIVDGAAVERFDRFVRTLPGWSDGPGYARDALIFQAN